MSEQQNSPPSWMVAVGAAGLTWLWCMTRIDLTPEPRPYLASLDAGPLGLALSDVGWVQVTGFATVVFTMLFTEWRRRAEAKEQAAKVVEVAKKVETVAVETEKATTKAAGLLEDIKVTGEGTHKAVNHNYEVMIADMKEMRQTMSDQTGRIATLEEIVREQHRFMKGQNVFTQPPIPVVGPAQKPEGKPRKVSE